MRLDDVVKKIKGPKELKFVKKVDGTISIIRDIVDWRNHAKSSVTKNGLKYGVIYLPKFYIDFEKNNGRDAEKTLL
jgi:carboxyl-terminal processing protease